MSAGSFDFLAQRLTIAAVAVMPPSEWPVLSATDLDVSADELERAARVWLWLLEVAPDSPDAERVRQEVVRDAPLLCAVHLPAAEFVHWLRSEPWADFDSTQRTGSEAWAMKALARAWVACEALGAMATQRSLAESV